MVSARSADMEIFRRSLRNEQWALSSAGSPAGDCHEQRWTQKIFKYSLKNI